MMPLILLNYPCILISNLPLLLPLPPPLSSIFPTLPYTLLSSSSHLTMWQFMEDIDKEINAMKLAINSRGRTVAAELMKQFDS